MSEPERYAGRSVLVTGAKGFIASWLAERLLEMGARVVAPLRDVEPHARFADEGIAARCQVVPADVTDPEAMLRILNEYEITDLFHLAAQPIVGIANRSPLSTWESNVRGTYTVLEACRARGVVGAPLERIVVASTDHAYGSHEELPYREDFGLRPRFPYDVSKGCADMIARSYAATYDMPVAVARPANVYGGGDRNWSRIVPDVARALVRGERPVIRSDGTPQRDYLYVEDAVGAYLAIAGSLDDPDHWGRAWNAGNGPGVPVLELVERLIAVSGRDVEPDIRGEGSPAHEIDRIYLDSSAIREELGWDPEWSLDDGLRKTYAWYERYLDTHSRDHAGAAS